MSPFCTSRRSPVGACVCGGGEGGGRGGGCLLMYRTIIGVAAATRVISMSCEGVNVWYKRYICINDYNIHSFTNVASIN